MARRNRLAEVSESSVESSQSSLQIAASTDILITVD
jgi:hypothetical protein